MARIWIVAALLLLAGCAASKMASSPGPCAGGEATQECQAWRYQNGGM